jgi:hypothetical protein
MPIYLLLVIEGAPFWMVCGLHQKPYSKKGTPFYIAYCQGEGWQFYETNEIVAIYRGVAPVYKPGVLATGQFPQAGMGYTDTQRATGYIEVFREDGSQTYPNYERYEIQTAKNYDKLYELKVDPEGEPVYGTTGWVRTAKWKVRSLVPWHGDQVSPSFRNQKTSRAGASE